MRRKFSVGLAATALGLVARGVSGASPPSANLAAALADTKALLNGGQQANIVVLGDSLSVRQGSYLPYFTQHLQNFYGHAGAGFQGFSLWTGAGFNGGWLNTGINTDMIPHRSLDGLYNTHNGVPGGPVSAFYTPKDRTVQLQYVRQPGGGSFQVMRNQQGALVATIDTNSRERSVGTFDFTLGAGESQYTILPLPGTPVTVLGQNNIRSTPGVRVHRGANGGWGVNNFLQRDYTFNQQLGILDTDLIMIWIGQNDQAYTRASYAQRINLLVDRVQASSPAAEIVLVGTYDQGSSALSGLVDGMYDVATARNLGFINLYGTAGNAAFFQANGYLDDGVHFSESGGAYVGQFLFDAFATDGVSLGQRQSIPEPTGCVAMAFMGAGLFRRRARR